MENISMLEKLSDHIDELLRNYKELRVQNEELKKDLLTCRAASQKKDEEIAKLQEELAMRDLQIEEIVKRIESYLG